MLCEGLRSGLPGDASVGTCSACARSSAQHARADERAGCVLLRDRAGPTAGGADPGARDLGLGTELERSGPRLVGLAPLDWISDHGLAFGRGPASLVGYCATDSGRPRQGCASGATWGCGYLAPTPRMQYTSSSFAQMLVGMFAWVLRPRTHRPEESATVSPARPISTARCPTRCLTKPCFRRSVSAPGCFPWFRVFQQGNIQAYLLYIFLALIILLLWR